MEVSYVFNSSYKKVRVDITKSIGKNTDKVMVEDFVLNKARTLGSVVSPMQE